MAEIPLTNSATKPVAASRRVTAIRWELHSEKPYPGWAGILATDRLRYLIANGLNDSTDPEDFLLTGHTVAKEADNRFGLHAHAHWLWLEDSTGRVTELAMWTRSGLAAPQRKKVLAIQRLGKPSLNGPGYVPGNLELCGVGSAADVLPELGANLSTTVWRSAMPYLVSRHMKPSRKWEELVQQDIENYLGYYYGKGEVNITDLKFSKPSINYHTCRWDPNDSPKTPVLIERLEVDKPLTGPLCLGHHSHFGFGRFLPVLS